MCSDWKKYRVKIDRERNQDRGKEERMTQEADI